MNTITLFAPHVDDEVIGCRSLLAGPRKLNLQVVYTEPHDQDRMKEADYAAKKFRYSHMFIGSSHINEYSKIIRESTVVVAPDHHWELHPAHKKIGSLAWIISQQHKKRFISYSTNMNTPYIVELPAVKQREKQMAMDLLFPSQASLWKYDYRYFLFEGLSEWAPNV